jgi:uncharacterized membrane protein YraQ (UPF0718 family)
MTLLVFLLIIKVIDIIDALFIKFIFGKELYMYSTGLVVLMVEYSTINTTKPIPS